MASTNDVLNSLAQSASGAKASGMSFDGNYDLTGMLSHFLDFSKNTTYVMPEDNTKTYVGLGILLVIVFYIFKK